MTNAAQDKDNLAYNLPNANIKGAKQISESNHAHEASVAQLLTARIIARQNENGAPRRLQDQMDWLPVTSASPSKKRALSHGSKMSESEVKRPKVSELLNVDEHNGRADPVGMTPIMFPTIEELQEISKKTQMMKRKCHLGPITRARIIV